LMSSLTTLAYKNGIISIAQSDSFLGSLSR
jgi:hypothetical protein